MILRQNQKIFFSMHSRNRIWITTFEFIFSRGRVFCPLIIFREKKIQKTWTDQWLFSVYEISQNEWTDNDVGLTWFKNIFHSEIINLKKRKFFIINDHISHVFVAFIEFCWAVDIVPLWFFFHTIYYFQSLNFECFELLTKTYKNQLKKKIEQTSFKSQNWIFWRIFKKQKLKRSQQII